MIKTVTIELKPEQINDDALIRKIIARECLLNSEDISSIEYLKRSLDSRNKKPRYQLLAEVYCNENPPEKESIKSTYRDTTEKYRVIIVGSGPAGYFAALELLEMGIKPIVFERGKDVQSRRRDIRDIMQNGIVNPDSNYCFGEGGAGTYSDGKLYTRSDKRGNTKKVLNILVEHGANPDILVDAHPHIGSNKLHKIVAAIRETIIQHGGEVHFESKVTDIIIRNSSACGVIVNTTDEHFGDSVILATGHSARDIYYLCYDKKINIEVKPYAVGFRIEHYQELIDKIQYGSSDYDLPPASYRLAAQANGRGVFSFCMCPGGIIVPAVTAEKELVVNGMSMSKRSSKFANSGIVTTVDERDFTKFLEFGALAGLKFQEELESRFFTADNEHPLKAPAQRLVDFISNSSSSSLMESSYIPGLVNSNLNRLFPKDINIALLNGLTSFGTKLRGFITSDANVIGLESRTSSPVRIPRDRESLIHNGIDNLYPCGEGAGYAGGIVSSAIDGQNTAKAILSKLIIS